jgi:glycosyltransferase involved in cell wall biosynthesis
MTLAFVTTDDPHDIHAWSGTGYHIAQALQKQGLALDFIGPLRDRLSHKMTRKCKRHYYELWGQRYRRDPEPLILKDYARQISQRLGLSDRIFSVTANPIAYLECDRPLAFYADATFAGLSSLYPHYQQLCPATVRHWHRMEAQALQRCTLAIYASDWAAQTAVAAYGVSPEKVRVVPLGANLNRSPAAAEVQRLIQQRPTDRCQLLFMGVDWYRKGGDIALAVATALNATGLPTELTLVGCQPPADVSLPEFVRPLGFISKATEAGQAKIAHLLGNAHFLLLPSRAECYGLAFCEANAFGVPCVGSDVGGVPTIIKSGRNGQLFSISADIQDYCDYIGNLFSCYGEYEKLALSAFKEYQDRLNWTVAGKNIKAHIETLC